MKNLAALTVTLIAAASLTLLGGQAAQAQQMAQYCAGSPTAVDVLLVDQSELFDETDKQRFSTGMNRFFAGLRPARNLDIYAIEQSASSLTPLFSVCIPGCEGEIDSGKTNWNTVCSALRVQRDKQDFQRAFVSVMRALVNSSKKAEGTAILGTLERLGVQYRGGQIKSLTIFSDMLEYSPGYNRAINHFDEKRARKLLRRSQKNLGKIDAFQNADVVVFGLGKRLGQEHLIVEKSVAEAQLPPVAFRAFRNFWRNLFTTVLGVPDARLVLTLNY